ncbi:MAG: OpgC family protein, partial [Lautropia sp.]
MPTAPTRRDLRLDFFRGLALWFIFIDHVPSSTIADLTFRNFGFSDATEIFVFISGYTAAIVYGQSLAKRGFVFMSFQVLKRCWQLYAAHILLFVFFIAQITWVANRFDNASFIDELNVNIFYDNPQQSMIRALLLHYRPVNLDVLPLYMALLLMLPPMLWAAVRWPLVVFALSAALWLGVQAWHWALPIYEGGD